MTVNAAVAWLRRAGVPSVTDPLPQSRTCPSWTDGGVRPNATHTIAGSRIRHSKGVLPLRLDEEWRTRLPARDRRLVTLATSVSRWRYGYTG